jgi:hypothetical protein|tara:strand:+ start:8856 stop:9065 length:210 start_codon:yes stop_codon:yes gene_type:complete
MIEEINEDVLFTELDKKQDVMLNTKQGFFTDAEGSPGDMGLCQQNGKVYISIKLNDHWYFSELKQSQNL